MDVRPSNQDPNHLSNQDPNANLAGPDFTTTSVDSDTDNDTGETLPSVGVLYNQLVDLRERVEKLENRRESKGLKEVRDRQEDICDYLYGTNVRPPLTSRDDGDYAATVSND